MKKNLLLFPLFLYFSLQLFAQKDFRNGYIITASNDTLLGKIEIRSNLKNKKSCVYKNDTSLIEYLPSQLHGFGYSGDKIFTSQVIDSMFLEVLVKGTLSLYKIDNQNFIIKKEGISALYSEENQRIDSVQGQILLISNNAKWKGILTVLTFDCLANTQLIEKLNLDEKSLTLFVIDYNKCKGSAYQELKKMKPWSKWEYGVSAGIVHNALSFKPGVGTFTYLEDSYQSTDGIYGALLNFSSPRFTEKFSLQAEFLYVQSRFSSDIVISNTYYNTVMNFKSLLVPLSIKYSIIDRHCSLFMNIGANLTQNIKSESELIVETEEDHVINTSESGAFLINKTQIGYYASIEISKAFGSFTIGGTIRYFGSTHYYHFEDFTVNINRFSMALIIIKK